MTELTQLRQEVPVVVVGGGLSGLALSREYTNRGIDHVVFEASPAGKDQSIHYLTSQQSANSLGLGGQFEDALSRRLPITGYTVFDGRQKGLVALESLPPRRERPGGFATFSIGQIRDWLTTSQELPIQRGQAVKSVEVNAASNLLVKTAVGDEYQTRVVVDATGSRAKILQLAQIADPKLIGERLVRYCYGGVFPYAGPEDQLIFADQFPSPVDTPQERAGWIMPLGEGKAEVVVGMEGTLNDRSKWHTTGLPKLLSAYIEWFRDRGIEINPNGREEAISGVYSQELLDYRKLPVATGVVAFGESAGLNHPVNGYLIDGIARYAAIMADQTERYLETHKWDPYRQLVAESKVNYGLAQSHAKRKIAASESGEGRYTATTTIKDLITTEVGDDGYWKVIDHGIPVGSVLKSVIKHPRYVSELWKIGKLYAKELMSSNGLYFSELGLKLKSKLRAAVINKMY